MPPDMTITTAELPLILENVPGMIAYFDASWHLRFCNRRYADWFETTRENLLGRHMERIGGPEVFAAIRIQMDRVLGGESVCYERIHRRHDGVLRHVEVSGVPHFEAGPGSAVIGVFALLTDVTARRQAQLELQGAKERLDVALGNARLSLWEWNGRRDPRALYVDANWGPMLGLDDGPARHYPVEMVERWIHPDDWPRVRARQIEALKGQSESYDVEQRVRGGGDQWHWILSRGRVVERDAAGRAVRFAGISMDITPRKQAEAALAASELRFRALTELSSDWYWEEDGQGRFMHFARDGQHAEAAAAVSALLCGGSPPAGIVATAWTQHRDSVLQRRPFHDLMLEHRTGGTVRYYLTSGVPILDEHGQFRGYRGVAKDVTARALAEQRVAHLAFYDGLTGLPNRSLIQDRMADALATAARHARMLAVLFLDLDNFKNVNDSLGHDIGDALLIQLAARLTAELGSRGSIGRLGGDEFLLVTEVQSEAEAALLAGELIASLNAPVIVSGHALRISGSIGVSLYPQHGADVATLMRHADLAMYEAKATQRSEFRFFTDELNRRIQRRFALENDLRRGIDDGELQLHYQPRVEFASGRVVGLEALVRWNRPGEPQIAPGEFIPIAEEMGLIGRLGDWVLREACRQAADWSRTGHDVPPISVNVSVSQLHRADFAQSVEEILAETGLPSRLLELEITENLMFELTQQTHATLDSIDRMGIGLSVDDFGSGYSSLSCLKRVPINVLKIDQSFVRDIVDDPSDAALVSAILAIAKSLGLRAVAEGVESADHLQALQDLGCRYGQGFFFSEPLPATACVDLLLKPARAA
jgi:diguanylate cyclase (GGDEF)-like protein/PAS domain S-box-containing protein